MTDLISQIRRLNGLSGLSVAEPFAGGAGASLNLLYLERTPRIYINDADPAIFAFWWALLNRSKRFLDKLESQVLDLANWRNLKATYESSNVADRLEKGYAAFFLNRCNHSGIIMNGGPIGGFEQSGKWKIDARFNKVMLKKRCAKVCEYKERIEVSSFDGIDLIECADPNDVFFFIDPPYYEKGQTLYLNSLEHDYHEQLAKTLRSKSKLAWMLTYDDCEEIREMYDGWANVRSYSLRYVASERRHGREILITPRWMKMPTWQRSESINW